MSWRARLSTSLNELRVVYCASSPSSIGTRADEEANLIQRDCKREFIKNNYTDLKALNPGLPIYVRPADGVEPHIAARYERGVYEVRPTSNMNSDQILGIVKELEAISPVVNSKTGGGIGGDTFKLADIV